MNWSFVIAFFISSLLTSLASCDKTAAEPVNPEAENENGNNTSNAKGSQMRIKIGTSTFTTTLYDNATASAFKARLPFTLAMKELNGNEKFAELPNSLPANASNPGTIQTGDLMLYGSNTLVLFYETFRTSYSYTKIGRVDNPSGLATVLGAGNITVSFTLE
jgi:hypothetical protein